MSNHYAQNVSIVKLNILYNQKFFSEINKLIPLVNGKITKMEKKRAEKINEFINLLRMGFQFNIKDMYEKI